MSASTPTHPECIGILPAGGWARRLASLPCSKEIYPIGLQREARPRVVCHHVLETMRQAGIKHVFLALRQGKWDIPAYLGNGSPLDMHLAYLIVQMPQHGPAYSVDEAFPFVQGGLVALGFPDCLFEPKDAFAHLIARQHATGADLVLGVFPFQASDTFDRVDLGEDGCVHSVVLTPAQTHHRHTWIMAVWTPVFTRFFHRYVQADAEDRMQEGGENRDELVIGDVFQAAIDDRMPVQGVFFPGGSFLDIGTPDNLARAVHTVRGVEPLRRD